MTGSRDSRDAPVWRAPVLAGLAAAVATGAAAQNIEHKMQTLFADPGAAGCTAFESASAAGYPTDDASPDLTTGTSLYSAIADYCGLSAMAAAPDPDPPPPESGAPTGPEGDFERLVTRVRDIQTVDPDAANDLLRRMFGEDWPVRK